MADVFISYASADRQSAEVIVKHLDAAGYSVFLDQRAIVAGLDWSQRIMSEIQSAGATIVLLSSHSRQSLWVREEVQVALDQTKHVIPVLLDDEATQNWIWPLLAQRQGLRLELGSRDCGKQLDALVEGLRAAGVHPAGRPGLWNSLSTTSAALRHAITSLLRR